MKRLIAFVAASLLALSGGACTHYVRGQAPPPASGSSGEVTNALLSSIALAVEAPLPVAAGFACEIEKIGDFGPFTERQNGTCDARNYALTCRTAAGRAAAACNDECKIQAKRTEGWPNTFGADCTGDIAGVTRPTFDETKHCILDDEGRKIGVQCTVSAACQCDP